MKILVDILHPAHVHFFRNFYAEMTRRGHRLQITARAKEVSLDLLEGYKLPYILISRQKTGTLGLASEMITRTYRLSRVMQEFQPDVMTGIMGPSIALAGALRRVPVVIFYDTEFASQTNWFSYKLAHSVCTPDCYRGSVPGRHFVHPGYHELAYLHSNRFTPDPTKLRAFGVQEGEPYSLVRFVFWKAIHDRRETGLTLEQKLETVRVLARHGKVLVSSEGPLPEELQSYGLRGPVEDIHHLLAYSQIVVGESATMSSEAAVLGVPAIFIATTGRGYTDDQEARYGLVRHFKEEAFEAAIEAIEGLFADGSPRRAGAAAREKLLRDKIDVTEWMVEYFESQFAMPGSDIGSES